MRFVNPFGSKPMIPIREASSQRSPRDADSVSQQWKKVNECIRQVISLSKTVEALQMQVAKMRRRIVGGGETSSFPWQSPKELDTTIAVSKDTFVYISPLNPLVTTGLTDIDLGVLVNALPGIWQAAQDVPAQTSDTPPQYNVPQIPYPGGGSAPVGTPLKGDLDGADVYWILWSQAPVCPNV